ncbi:MAG: hypothetical protein JW871_05505 [Endomicrobiales bacterium]|nr:hypothetical protein [Endomicrobiales bacterium]
MLKKYSILFIFAALGLGFVACAKKQVVKEEPKTEAVKIEESDDAVKFIDAAGNTVKEIELGKKEEYKDVPGMTGKIRFESKVYKVVPESKDYVGIVDFKIERAFDLAVSTRIFSYYDREGNVLWQKKGIASHNYDDFHVRISSDGNRIFIVTRKHLYVGPGAPSLNWPVVYNQKGDVVWAFGEYTEVSQIAITKNGKYGLIRGEKKENGKEVSGILFFEIDNKKTEFFEINIDNLGAMGRISDDGHATVYDVDLKILDKNSWPFKVERIETTVKEFQL